MFCITAFVGESNLLRSLLGSLSGIRVKVRIAQTELTVCEHVKKTGNM
jgi:hypothetical protein